MIHAPHHNFRYAADTGVFGDLYRWIGTVYRCNLSAQLFRQTQVASQPFDVFAGQLFGFRRLYKKSCKAAVKGFGHTRGGSYDLGVGRRRGKANQDMLPRTGGLPLPVMYSRPIKPVRRPAHGDFTQRRQVFRGKKVLKRLFGLAFPVDFAGAQPFDQIIRFDIHKLHLACQVEHEIRYTFVDHYAGDGRNKIVQGLQMLYVNGGVNIDPRPQKLLYVLVSLGMAASRRIAVRKLIYKNQLRPAL